MWGLIKLVFFTFVAVAVGVFVGTVPVGGRTLADRIVSLYQAGPGLEDLVKLAKTAASALAGAKAGGEAAAARRPYEAPSELEPPRAKPVTAGAANRPDAHSAEDRDALEQVIADRVGK